MTTQTKSRKPKPRSSDWKPDELTHCEIASVEFPEAHGGPIVFNLTPRGGREHERLHKAFVAEQKRVKKAIARGDYAIPADLILNMGGASRYWG